MDRIASFCINHDTLVPGMYLSRVDGDVNTYDLRFVRPNTPPYLPTDAMHTIEHLVATYVRNSAHKDGIIYFGPMGCRTGFYFLTRGIPHADAIRARLAEELGVPVSSVSVKAKTNEGMDAVGAGKGIAVHCVALLS